MTTTEQHPLALRKCLEPLHAGRVLDVASGIGQFTRMLADCLGSYDEIVGIDTSEAATQRANEAFSDPNVRFEQADATALPFSDNRFETVAISNSLHHMEDLAAVLREIRRVLVPSGRIILFEMHTEAPNPASRNAIDLHEWAAAVDRATGKFHNPVLSHDQLLAHINALQLVDARLVEWHSEETSSEVDPLVSLIDQVLARAEGTPE